MIIMFAASGNKLFTKSVTALGTLAGNEITSLLLTKREISTETKAIIIATNKPSAPK